MALLFLLLQVVLSAIKHTYHVHKKSCDIVFL